MTASVLTAPRRRRRDPAAEPWKGGYRRYDIVKEFTIALVVIAILTVALAAVFGSPDDKSVTLAGWSKAAPNDFVLTAVTELDGTSGSASYGAPYNRNGPGQKLGPLSLQRWAGVTIPVNSAQDFVIGPLSKIPDDPVLAADLRTWKAASSAQQVKWASAYDTALGKAPNGDPSRVAKGNYGPVPLLTSRLLRLAQSGALDGQLLAQGSFYQTDYTKPLLFLADGSYLETLARAQHLGGDQWGMMNETGLYPGQAWLWLYTFWYQIKPYSTSGNGDALVWGTMAVLTLLFVLLPFIPGVRSIPRKIPVYRLIWRDHYRQSNR